jgi:hypothetical protein
MEKEFVPYQEALALKQLGFDEPCFGWFASDRTLVKEVTEKTDFTLAPTFSQAFRFFREKYGLSGNIDCCDKLCEWNIKSSKLDKSIFSSNIQSYEQAELQCLQELIKIVKNK